MRATDIEIKLPDTEQGKRVKEIFAITLFNEGILSKSQASKLIDKTIREFHEILISNGVEISGKFDKNTNNDLLDILVDDDK